MVLSANDKKVLLILADNPLASNHTIAVKMNVHHATIAAIRKKLEDVAGLKYRIDISPRKTGLDNAYMIYFRFVPGFKIKEDYKPFMRFVEKYRSVVSVGLVVHSRWDGWLKVVSKSEDMDYMVFSLKKDFGSYIDSFEIIKHMDIGLCGDYDMQKVADLM
ncbi:MAG: Lrp/AsnC family transcriptional regulator [archaeon]|nr:Lrp/AsnC family transcriptional regulator [archaeon]